MATYAIGDIQGCYEPLIRLLDKIKFDPTKDSLWFTGDLVNRGPDSVKTLDFVIKLGNSAITVLGNHDLALLALSANAIDPKPKETFTSVLEASNAFELITWLRARPLVHNCDKLGYIMTHAGIYPGWTIEQACNLGNELHQTLIGPQFEEFMHNMFGRKPESWNKNLSGWDRLRFITNALTRMRYCTKDGKLDLKSKGPPSKHEGDSIPWFSKPNPDWTDTKIIFGHWASLEGKCEKKNIFALDTGCIWGGCLTALCLETQERFHIDCE